MNRLQLIDEQCKARSVRASVTIWSLIIWFRHWPVTHWRTDVTERH